MSNRYQIADEPRASPVSHLAVNPFWPLFAQMLVGSWLALPWFLFNGFALGSINRGKELACAAVSLAASLVLAWLTVHYEARLDETQLRFALLAIVVVKIASAYALYVLQAVSFELWEYFGGKARNALLVLVAGYFIKVALVMKPGVLPVVAQLALG